MTEEASFDGAVDDFLGEEAAETPEKTPAKKEQPAKKEAPPAKAEKAPAKQAKTEETDESEETPDDGTSEKPKDGPWRAELATRGIDTPEVNQYMSEVVQPYITRLEQQGGPIAALFEGDQQAAEIASAMLQDLGDDPAATVAKIIMALDVDDEAINKALEGMTSEEGETPEAPEAPQQDPNVEEELSPEQQWIRERMAEEEAQANSESYDAFMKTLADEFGEGFDETLFSLVLSSAKDIEHAMEMYPQIAEMYAKPAAKPAPVVMGRDRPGAAPQPTTKNYDGTNAGWESAMDDLFAEERARRSR